jgi:hypothetical protein
MANYDRTYAASPQFLWTNDGTLTTGTALNISWETYNTASQKYLPFNLTRIVNNGESDIWFYPNQDQNNTILIPKGTIISIDRSTLPAIRSFTITNAGTNNISANKIVLTNSREGVTNDSVVARLHNRLIGNKKQGVI